MSFGQRRSSSGTASRGSRFPATSAVPQRAQHPSALPTMSSIQSSYAALMEDDEAVPVSSSHGGTSSSRTAGGPSSLRLNVGARASSGRGSARGSGSASAVSMHRAPPQVTHYAPSAPDTMAAGRAVHTRSSTSSAGHMNSISDLEGSVDSALVSPIGRQQGTAASHGLMGWTLPTAGGGNTSLNGSRSSAASRVRHGGSSDLATDEDDVNENGIYYNECELRSGVTQRGNTSLSPGGVRRGNRQASTATSDALGHHPGMGAGGRGLSRVAVGGGSSDATIARLNNEHRMTNRGRQIRADVDDMMDTMYGNEATTQQRAPGGGGNRAALERVTGPTNESSPFYMPMNAQLLSNVSGWRRGPQNQDGRTFDASDRNLLCMDVRGDMAVVGSADHGLRVFDIKSMREKRNLYGKKVGHTEWVTSVKYLADGRILSGGMDSKLCLWHASALRCDDLLGHTGSVSQVAVNPSGLAVSSSYDRTLRVWDCNSRRSLLTLAGHGQPVMSFAWTGSMIMSGDRRGAVKVWDVETGTCAATVETKHGQIGSLAQIMDADMGHLSAVGDQAGVVNIFDFRRTGTNPLFSLRLHPGGVVSSLKGMLSEAGRSLLVSAGADRQIHVLDPRVDFSPIHTFTDHKDFIYEVDTIGPLVLSGGGNGWLLVHDVTTGKCLYGLGANNAAVRCILASNSHLVAAGDDGKAMVYDF